MNCRLSRAWLWRVAAMALLLYAAVDILALDTGLWDPHGAASCCDGSDLHDDCFCCCRHIVVTSSVSLQPVQPLNAAAEMPIKTMESVPATVAELPPRA